MRDDDDLLVTLGRAEREAARVPERWLAVSMGTASASELAEIAEEALRDPDVRRYRARFTPLEADLEQAITARALRAVRARRGWRAAWSALAAAAVVLLGWMAWAMQSGLPAYTLEVSAQDAPMRGREAVTLVPRHHADSALTLVLRPERRRGDVAVDAFVEVAGQVRRLAIPYEVASTGAIRVDGRVRDLLPGIRGEAALLLVVRARGAAPLGPEALAGAQAEGRVHRYHLRIVE